MLRTPLVCLTTALSLHFLVLTIVLNANFLVLTIQGHLRSFQVCGRGLWIPGPCRLVDQEDLSGTVAGSNDDPVAFRDPSFELLQFSPRDPRQQDGASGMVDASSLNKLVTHPFSPPRRTPLKDYDCQVSRIRVSNGQDKGLFDFNVF